MSECLVKITPKQRECLSEEASLVIASGRYGCFFVLTAGVILGCCGFALLVHKIFPIFNFKYLGLALSIYPIIKLFNGFNYATGEGMNIKHYKVVRDELKDGLVRCFTYKIQDCILIELGAEEQDVVVVYTDEHEVLVFDLDQISVKRKRYCIREILEIYESPISEVLLETRRYGSLIFLRRRLVDLREDEKALVFTSLATTRKRPIDLDFRDMYNRAKDLSEDSESTLD